MRQKILLSVLFAASVSALYSQNYNKCGTMQVLEKKFKENPALRQKFESREQQLQKIIHSRINNGLARQTAALVTVPVVFHIVLANQSQVSDAQVFAQLDTLNRDYAGLNGDSVKLPSYFKSLFGKSGIQFCLAQRTPQGDTTNGIVRQATTAVSFNYNDNSVKHVQQGGADAWNTRMYLNVWICNMTNGVLGYSTFPDDDVPDEQGVVIQYSTLPGGSLTSLNKGKTLTHEAGHYFNLYHIWGDDDGACTGTDFVDDTPNQANYTSACPNGMKTDSCSPASPGILYQDYMDYTDDDCMVLFTTQQVVRMEAALSTYRSSLFASNGCQPLVRFTNDADLRSVNSPDQRLCSSTFSPAVTVRNLGTQPLTSLILTAQIDGGAVSNFNWSGNLPTLSTGVVTMNPLTVTQGNHVITIYSHTPNNNPDEDTGTDTLRFSFIYYTPFNPPVAEGFEGSTFPPAGWDIINPDGLYTWQRVTGVAKTGNAAVAINGFNYNSNDAKDYLRMPEVNIAGADSAFVIFQVAAASYTTLGTANASMDTLEVLLSPDCGKTYTSLYKKGGADLVTRQVATRQSFVPGASEWRKDSIDITPYISMGTVMIAFRNTNEYENNIYLDDVNLYTRVVNPNLKAKGFLVTPNPTTGMIAVQFYPQPKNLTGIVVYSSAGQKIAEVKVATGQSSNLYNFNLGGYSSGMYIVRALFTDRILTQKILKLK